MVTCFLSNKRCTVFCFFAKYAHCFQSSSNIFKSVTWQKILPKVVSFVPLYNISSVRPHKIKFCLLIQMKQLPSPQKKKKSEVITHRSMRVIAKLTTIIHFRAFKIMLYPDNSVFTLTSQPLQTVSLPTAKLTGEHVYAASHTTHLGNRPWIG